MNILSLYIKDVFEILSQNQRSKLLFFTFLFLIGTLLETIGVGFIIPVIEAISNYDRFILRLKDLNLDSLYELEQDKIILLVIGLLLLIYTIKNLFLTLLSYLQFKFLKEIKFYLGNKVLNDHLQKNYLHHLNNNSSRIIRNINDTTFATEAVKNLMIIISETFVVIGISIFLFIYQPYGTLISLLLMIIFLFFFQIFFHKKSKLYGEGRFHSEEKKLKLIKDIFGSIKDIKLKNRESFFSNKFSNINQVLTSFEMRQNFISSLPRYWLEWTTILVMVILVFYFTSQKIELDEYFVILGVFAAAAFRLMPSFSRIISSLQRMKFVYPVLEEFLKINSYEDKSNIKNFNKDNHKNLFEKKIILKDVNFIYPENNSKILNDVNLEITKNEIIGISGESGSGKSTLVSLITGLLKPTSGDIFLDDIVNIHKLDNINSWQKKIGYVPQNIFIHDSSIIENIAFGIDKKFIDIEKIINLLEKMQLNDLAKDIKNDKHFSLGEYGDKISGGQKQRLGIARALYEEPEILILDESTSALDKLNEEKIINDLLNLKNKVTVIIISHREYNLRNCDKIFIIEKSKVIKK